MRAFVWLRSWGLQFPLTFDDWDWLRVLGITAAAVLLLNFPHEAAHWVGFYFSHIPSCIYWAETNPLRGINLELTFIPGVVAGPLFNFGVGGLSLWGFSRADHFRGLFFCLLLSSWLFRPVVAFLDFAFVRTPDNPADERLVQELLAGNMGPEAAWVVAIMLAALPVLCLLLVLHKTRGLGSYKDRATLGGLGFVAVWGGLALIILVGAPLAGVPIAGSCP